MEFGTTKNQEIFPIEICGQWIYVSKDFLYDKRTRVFNDYNISRFQLDHCISLRRFVVDVIFQLISYISLCLRSNLMTLLSRWIRSYTLLIEFFSNAKWICHEQCSLNIAQLLLSNLYLHIWNSNNFIKLRESDKFIYISPGAVNV